MSKYTDENVKIFIDESLEHLSDIENELLTIERGGADIDQELVNKVYRTAHSIKGAAGFMGLDNIKQLTHEMENILGRIRSRDILPDSQIINVLLLAADTLRNLINDIDHSNEADVSSHLDALNRVMEHTTDAAEDESTPSPATDETVHISFPGTDWGFDVSKDDISQARRTGKKIYLVELDLIQHGDTGTKIPMSPVEDMNQLGVIMDSRPDPATLESLDIEPDQDTFLFPALFATTLRPADIQDLLGTFLIRLYLVTRDNDVKPVGIKSTKGISDEKDNKADTDVHPVDDEQDSVSGDIRQAPEKDTEIPPLPAIRKKVRAQTSLRVNIDLLDSLMTLAGELVLGRNQLLQSLSHHDRRALDFSSQRIDLITSELQEAIMHTRMQPIRNIFNKFPRVVRDLAMDLHKQIELTIEGKSVELDKSIIEGLDDPMTHLIRNAVDHGIELPELRTRLGKNPRGHIHLKAYHEAGQVNIEISDDGKGMDGNQIAERAVARGLVNVDLVRSMPREEKVNLIFLPGFSTSDQVTDISGRGVGMDVVKTNLDKLGGIVDIDSEPGEGTTIRIKLPLTLAIIPSLLVSDGKERYAIPQVNVVELLRIPPAAIRDRIEQVGDAMVIRLRDKLLPLLRLSEILGTADEKIRSGPDTETGETRRKGVSIVFVSTGAFQYGMIVDALHDSEEIVVKPLGRHLKECRGYAGATILGDGRVALILDVIDLARMAELISISTTERAPDLKEKDLADEANAQTLLLFRNTETARFAVPLELVERIEKIDSGDIEFAGGRRVIQCRGTTMPLFDVGDLAPVEPFKGQGKALVVVFFIAGMDVGLLAIPPIDSATVVCHFDDITLKQPGIMGSVTVGGQTVMMVDVIGLVETLRPEWFIVKRRTKGVREEGGTVLLAEDSRFFRNQMKCSIENAGYEVMDAEDGLMAWELFQKNASTISVVVTDLEMPNLDGFGLTRKIKADERFGHIPVIAVSSLAGKKDIKKARDCGVDEYQIKLDREKLVECVRHYMQQTD